MTDHSLINSSDNPVIQLGQFANRLAAENAIADYRSRKAHNTLRAQDNDLTIFSQYMQDQYKLDTCQDFSNPVCWQGITWGLVKGFVNWMLLQGYATASLNRVLSTVKVYARLAVISNTLPQTEYAMIKLVQGYSIKEGKRINERRETDNIPTRKTRVVAGQAKAVKKSDAITISREQAKTLKTQPDSPQGHRDAVLMALLLDHGLRSGEVALLKVGNVDLAAGTITFYRPKVDKTQTLQLTTDAKNALSVWLKSADAPKGNDSPLLRGSRRGGKKLTDAGMSESSITERVNVLGAKIGLEGLSAHDCRHYWATVFYARCNDPLKLQEAGGWNSLAMPRRYVEWAAIANEGVGDLD